MALVGGEKAVVGVGGEARQQELEKKVDVKK
jgi:hypothetical protein